MSTPEIIIVIFYSIQLGVYLSMHGQEYPRKISFWTALLSTTVMFSLLYWAGLFH